MRHVPSNCTSRLSIASVCSPGRSLQAARLRFNTFPVWAGSSCAHTDRFALSSADPPCGLPYGFFQKVLS